MGAQLSQAADSGKQIKEWSFSYEGHNPSFEDGWSKLSREVVADKIRGLVFGNAIGDALGLTTEFMNKAEAEVYYGKDGPTAYTDTVQDYHRSRWRCGDWTDDTDQLILMIASLRYCKGKASPTDFAMRLLSWKQHGFSELGDIGGMGIGLTTVRVLSSSNFLENPHQAADDIWQASGRYLAANGAIMRTAIAGAANFNDIEKVLWQTREFCMVTHADPRCIASCAVVTTAIALMLQGEYDAHDEKEVNELIKISSQHAEKFLQGHDTGLKDFHKYMGVKTWTALKLDDAKTLGYTYKAMGAGIFGLRTDTDFRRTITELVMEAGDADSNGAVCGALLGCKYGYSGLPKDLLEGLVYHDWLDDWVDKFLAMLGLADAKRLGGPSAAAKDQPGNMKVRKEDLGDVAVVEVGMPENALSNSGDASAGAAEGSEKSESEANCSDDAATATAVAADVAVSADSIEETNTIAPDAPSATGRVTADGGDGGDSDKELGDNGCAAASNEVTSDAAMEEAV
eukprot:scpid43169/ scgid16793/ Uncharacterized protein MJ1187